MAIKRSAVGLCLVLLSLATLAAGQPSTAKAPVVPAAIAAAFKAAYPSAVIRHVGKEKYEGKDAYEVESVDGGKTRDLIYWPDGTVAEVEEEIATTDLPAAVAKALKTDFPTATITRCERAVARGVTSYEMAMKGAKVKSVEYTAEGKRK